MKHRAAVFALICLLLLPSCGEAPPLLIVGSSCMGRALRLLAEDSPTGEVEIQLGGTELGLTALLEGRADLAACSRALTDEDVGIEATLLATDAIAVAVHPSNPVEQLTSAQLRLIFEGQITSWAAVGGADETIAPIGREAASGTRVSFESALGITSPAYGQELGETGIVRTAIASCAGAVGYLSASYADDSVKIIAVDGVLPENDAVQSGAYPLSRPFLLCRRADDTCREVIDFLTYATGDAAQRLKQLGLQTPSDPTEAENFPSSS